MNTLEKLAKRDEAMNVAEVAKILGVTTQHIYRLCTANKIPRFLVGAAIRFWPHEIIQFARGRLILRKLPQSTRSGHRYSKKKHGS
jgi:excisionase family DNA binding protein